MDSANVKLVRVWEGNRSTVATGSYEPTGGFLPVIVRMNKNFAYE